MEEYLRGGRLKAAMDNLGARVLIAGAAQIWFWVLWGVSVPSVTAGAALGLLGQMALSRWRREHALSREKALRRRLGGEMALEEMLMMKEDEAHRQAAALLASRYEGLTAEKSEQAGTVCRYGGEKLLIRCEALPAPASLGAERVAQAQRACLQAGADRTVICVTCACSREAAQWAEQGPVPVSLIVREEMLEIAGRMHPVTDEQLVALGARKRRLAPGGVARQILRPEKAKRYMTYGLGLVLMYVLTGLKYYPGPGCVCLALAVGCRLRRDRGKRL